MRQGQRPRFGAVHGFTLVELLVVLVVLGILLGIAVPYYLGIRNQATDASPKANIREAVPAAEGFFQQHGTYVGLDGAGALQSIDSGVSKDVTVSNVSATAYCLSDAKGSTSTPTWYFAGPGGTVTSTRPSGC